MIYTQYTYQQILFVYLCVCLYVDLFLLRFNPREWIQAKRKENVYLKAARRRRHIFIYDANATRRLHTKATASQAARKVKHIARWLNVLIFKPGLLK